MNKSELRYQCSHCYKTYKEQADAIACCPRKVDAVYVCLECGTSYASKTDADECCADSQPEAILQ